MTIEAKNSDAAIARESSFAAPPARRARVLMDPDCTNILA